MIFYRTKGRAREYAPWAVELYEGCEHKCTYCYNTKKPVKAKNEDKFYTKGTPKKEILSHIKNDVHSLKKQMAMGEKLMMCFGSDPYQESEKEHEITRETLRMLNWADVPFDVLTKNPLLAFERDKDLFLEKGGCLGSTILFCKDSYREKWEPGAPCIKDRVHGIDLAHRAGIRTWVSVEPVIEPQEALDLIKAIDRAVDLWKVGKINYHPEVENKVDWKDFAERLYELLTSLGTDYVIKDSLAPFLPPGSRLIKKTK